MDGTSSGPRRIIGAAAAVVVALAAIGVGLAFAGSTGDTYTGCLRPDGTLVKIKIGGSPLSPCNTKQTQISWNEVGQPGADGLPGADGVSAYEIWLAAGNAGTEADFLASLVGQQGPSGLSATELQYRVDANNCGTSTEFSPNGRCGLIPPDGSLNVSGVYLDPSDFPASASVRIEWVFGPLAVDQQACGRLYDYTANEPVAGSTACHTRTSTSTTWSERVPTQPFPLAAGRHHYVAQMSTDPVGPGESISAVGVLYIDW